MDDRPDEPWRHREAVVNGIRLHWVEQGQGPLAILLHGFPVNQALLDFRPGPG